MASLMARCTQEKYDIIIRNGLIYDGSGGNAFIADIGISEGIIKNIGRGLNSHDGLVIDAEGMIVCPGFIDIHTHCDEQIMDNGMNSLKNYLMQGVTTVVTGNCGDGTWEVDKFFNQLDSVGTGINIVHLAGHNTIRNQVMGMDSREPTADEMEEMKKMIRAAMAAGAAGMSTGLFYTPGAYSETPELIELAKVVKDFEGFYATHIRDESNYNIGLAEAVKEAVLIGEKSGVRVEISHIKALGKPVWGMAEKICGIIEEAKRRGVVIYADQYPYNASNTGLSSAVVPSWVSAGGRLKNNLNDQEMLPSIKKGIEENIERRGGAESLVIVSYTPDKRFDGKNLEEISIIKGMPVVETAIELIQEGNPSIISFNMKDSDIETFMQKDYVMTCSDGHIEVPGKNIPHPRNYGTFTRKIRKYVIDDKVITMEHAIRAATSLPAQMIGLTGRGSLKEGKIADIVVFNPDSLRDQATFEDPHQYSVGIEFLLINGQVVVADRKYNGKLAGQPLRLSNL
jgi:N-acyl-D-amino-acid deacylase